MSSTDKLWCANEIAAAVGSASSSNWSASGISIDSRTIKPGDLFIALRGPNFDGHDFIEEAFERGASGSLISNKPLGFVNREKLILVEDTYEGLKNLCLFARSRSTNCIAAVTGSVGKTSVTSAIAYLLGQQGLAASTEGNLNNLFGVPLSVARLPKIADFAVFELGMSQPGEIAVLTKLVKPLVAMITNIEAAHLGNFDSIEDIAREKAEILLGVQKGGAVILNIDNQHFNLLSQIAIALGIKVVTYGVFEEADFRLVSCQDQNEKTLINANFNGKKLEYTVGNYGFHWVHNSIGVLAVMESLGADICQAARDFSGVRPKEGRGRFHKLKTNGLTFGLIDDSYNANPASVSAAIAALSKFPNSNSGRRILVLGDMLELGNNEKKFHTDLATQIITSNISLVYATGNLMKNMFFELPEDKRAIWSEKKRELGDALCSGLSQGDLILVKGSFGMGMTEIVKRLLHIGSESKEI